MEVNFNQLAKQRANNITKNISGDISKGRSLPIGTIKKRPNGNFIKTANGWKYQSSSKKSKSNQDKKQFDQNNLPQVGQKVNLKNTGLVSHMDFEGQQLVVDKIVQTNLISQPKRITVKNNQGKTVDVNPDLLTESTK